MSNDMILLTGVTGFVGFRILERALEAGLKLRLAVRSEAKIEDTQSTLRRNGYDGASLTFVIVPDMTADNAFDEAVQGARYIIHVASPISSAASEDLEASLIKPAVDTTLAMLNAALKEKSIERVVITSSVAAVIPTIEPGVFTADNIVPDPQGPWTVPFVAYSASKKLALSASRAFIAEKRPAFSVVSIMPSFVVGRNGFAKSRADYHVGSNRVALAPLLGNHLPPGVADFACHIDDVADVHLAVLDPKITGHRNFGVNYDGLNGIDWNSSSDIVRSKAPELLEKGLFPLGGSVPPNKLQFDASGTEQELGLKFKSFEEMVVDLASAYAKLAS
jgi:nucleoside-diphosphate-sugar epimerase